MHQFKNYMQGVELSNQIKLSKYSIMNLIRLSYKLIIKLYSNKNIGYSKLN